jgi:hypothetical protein
MSEETHLIIGGPLDGSLWATAEWAVALGGVHPPTSQRIAALGSYVRRKYLLPDDETTLTCWVWDANIKEHGRG